jgi:hypothetical protein
VLADTAIRGADLDEAKASEALKKAEEARRSAKDKQEIAVVEGERAMLAAQPAAIRKLRKKWSAGQRGRSPEGWPRPFKLPPSHRPPAPRSSMRRRSSASGSRTRCSASGFATTCSGSEV